MFQRIICIFIFSLVLIACGGVENSKTIERSDYGAEWPLTIAEALLVCEPPSRVFVEVNGHYYGVNGIGTSYVGNEYPDKARDLRTIWQEDGERIRQLREAGFSTTEIASVDPRKSIHSLIEDGLELCE